MRSLSLLHCLVEHRLARLPVREELLRQGTLHLAQQSEQFDRELVRSKEGLLQTLADVILCRHRGGNVKHRVALYVVVYYAGEVVVRGRQQRVTVLQVENVVLLQRRLENLARFLALTLVH